MTASDVTSVIDAALEESKLAGLCLRLAATTGMRRGELVGLRWADLDGQILTVARSVTAARNGAALVHIVALVCIAIWLFSDDEGIPSSGSFGSWAFDAVAAILLVLGILEARAFRASRS